MIEEYDVVELAEDIATDLKTGTRGAVVMAYPSDPPEYEVEFVDDAGETIAGRTVRGDQLRKMDLMAPPRQASARSAVMPDLGEEHRRDH